MAALVELGSERWLKPGRYRWLRALAFLAVLAVACILAFNLAADATLRLAAMLAGEPFTTREAVLDYTNAQRMRDAKLLRTTP